MLYTCAASEQWKRSSKFGSDSCKICLCLISPFSHYIIHHSYYLFIPGLHIVLFCVQLDRLRPEFRLGLDALTKFVLERTRTKQVGATVMTGPILVGITQSFLDAMNSGAIPTISSSWQVRINLIIYAVPFYLFDLCPYPFNIHCLVYKKHHVVYFIFLNFWASLLVNSLLNESMNLSGRLCFWWVTRSRPLS